MQRTANTYLLTGRSSNNAWAVRAWRTRSPSTHAMATMGSITLCNRKEVSCHFLNAFFSSAVGLIIATVSPVAWAKSNGRSKMSEPKPTSSRSSACSPEPIRTLNPTLNPTSDSTCTRVAPLWVGPSSLVRTFVACAAAAASSALDDLPPLPRPPPGASPPPSAALSTVASMPMAWLIRLTTCLSFGSIRIIVTASFMLSAMAVCDSRLASLSFNLLASRAASFAARSAVTRRLTSS
mmetsp:Transcript_91327/g.260833  ORF Transcript_91327/g.260833 Transcript_91327/m.260833 type:complete len:237 (+) Transcript_91327:2242-2952(+)